MFFICEPLPEVEELPDLRSGGRCLGFQHGIDPSFLILGCGNDVMYFLQSGFLQYADHFPVWCIGLAVVPFLDLVLASGIGVYCLDHIFVGSVIAVDGFCVKWQVLPDDVFDEKFSLVAAECVE